MCAFLAVGTGASVLEVLGDAGEVEYVAAVQVRELLGEFVEADGAVRDLVEVLVLGGVRGLHDLFKFI